MYNVRFISLEDPAIDTYFHPEIIQGIEVPITGLMNDRYAARTFKFLFIDIIYELLEVGLCRSKTDILI
ncbi:hypothetical protein [Clostridium sp. BJN0013]|uniref:hypothetical protein n=1 Tax=Clostridium sp. BJN0013 TaxID=3236840 RepID=UPI0034C642DD